MTRQHTATGASTYATRPHCPAPYHDSYSASRRVSCTCPAAKEDRRIYMKRQKHGRLNAAYLDPTGTRRRLQALSAIGHPLRDLVRRLGWTGTPGKLMWGTGTKVHRHTRDAVAALYEQLSATPGPSNKARAAARRAGYAPPLAWEDVDIDDPAATPDLDDHTTPDPQLVDEVLVQRAVDGDARAVAALSRAERVEATRLLMRYGLGSGGVARRLAVSGATAARLVNEAQVAA